MNTKTFIQLTALSFLATLPFTNIAMADGKVRITNEDVIIPKDSQYAYALFLFEDSHSLKRFLLPDARGSATEILPEGQYQRIVIHIKKAEKNTVQDCLPDGKENYLTVNDGTMVNITIKQDGEAIKCTLISSNKMSMADN